MSEPVDPTLGLQLEARKKAGLLNELIRIHQPHCCQCGGVMPGPLGHGHAGKELCDNCKNKEADNGAETKTTP